MERFWEIDFLRGLAVVMMISYHLVFDLDRWGGCSLESTTGIWLNLARGTASMFLLLVGVSLAVANSRAMGVKINAMPKYLRRGLWIFSLGMAVTAVTWAAFRDEFVIFGVLHLIGISTVLSCPFLRYRQLTLLIGSAAVVIGVYLQGVTFNTWWLLWLGFVPKGLHTLDYFPLLPWFGLVLIGVFLGNWSYDGNLRRIYVPDLSGHKPVRSFCFLGRNSLIVYLVHQPLMILVLQTLGLIDFVF